MGERDDGLLAELGHWAGRAAESLQQRVRQQLRDSLARRIDEFRDELTDPDNLEALQDSLRRMATWTYRLGFSLDPSAEHLFDFFDWAERRHGRSHVLSVLQRHNPLTAAEFVDLFDDLLDGRSVEVDPRLIDAFEDVGRRRLVALLAELAAGPDRDPASASEDMQQWVQRFEQAPVPDRFDGLARRAAGADSDPGAAARPESPVPDPPTPDAPPDSPPSALSEGLRALVAAGDSPLARTMNRLMAPDVRLVTLSFVTAVQAYLTRTAIDALPDVAPSGAPGSEDDDVIDL